MATSVLVAILIQAFIGRVLDVHSVYWERISSTAAVGLLDFNFHYRYCIPLLIIFFIGLFCVFWPQRKPPRITS